MKSLPTSARVSHYFFSSKISKGRRSGRTVALGRGIWAVGVGAGLGVDGGNEGGVWGGTPQYSL